MSSGKAHARASKLLAIPTGLAVGAFCQWVGDYWAGSLLAASGATAGCGVLGQILSPDLDQEHITASEWFVIRRLGPLAGIWIAYWWVYATFIRHRAAISHFPVIGTAGRLLYLCWPIWFIRDRIAPVMTEWTLIVLTGVVVGLVISDGMHYLMDNWSTKRKRRRRRWAQR